MTAEIILGIILLVINIPFGWLGLILFSYYGKKTGSKRYYVLSVITYILSWVMMTTGIYLCGKDYAEYIINNSVTNFIYPIVFISFAVLIIIVLFKKKIFVNHKQNKM